MLYEKNNEEKLSDELFMNPTSEYRGTPFWAWNCRITRELIQSQLDVFKEMGFGGAHLHSRTGLETDYLGDEFMDLICFTDEEMKKRDMLCWLYDEDRYPSGAAGGIVTENINFRSRHLLLTREKKEGMCSSYSEFELKVKNGEKPAGYYLCAYRILTENGYMISYRRINGPQPCTDSAIITAKEGKLWFAYVELMRESPWYNDQTYVDTMNDEAIKRFTEVTHDRYYQKLGKEFGKSVPAIFTDEPQIQGSMALPDGESDEDVTLSYTDDLPRSYEKAFGVNLLDVLPEILWDLPSGHYSEQRYHYHDHLTERFVSAYSDTIARWCNEHNIMMTGHYLSEPTLYSQTLRLGEAMRCYRNQQLPGVDILCGDPEYSTIKQASSVARQEGREGVLCELYGVNHWDFDFKGHKLQGDWQAALGVTVRCHHLAFMSMEGEAKRDWPASINYQSPWWKEYSYIENYFSRVNTALTRGRAVVNVAVVHPIESYWLCYGPVAQTGRKRDQLDENFSNVIKWLLFGLIDFDFISESMLPDQVKEAEISCNVEEAGGRPSLKVGKMSYQVVIVPAPVTIRSTTLNILEKFADRGGRVIFMGKVPALVDAREDNRAERLAQKTEKIPFERYELLRTLDDEYDIKISTISGRSVDNLFYQMRQDGKDRWLFICHVFRKNNRIDQGEYLQVKIKGLWDITCYNAMTGCTYALDSDYDPDNTVIKVKMYSEDSLLWKLTPVEGEKDKIQKADTCSQNQKDSSAHDLFPVKSGKTLAGYGLVAGDTTSGENHVQVIKTILTPDDIRPEEPNVLLLDRASWQLDNEPWHNEEEILRLDNKIRAILGYPLRQDAYIQPWRVKEAPENNIVRLRYEIQSRRNVKEAVLAMERPEKAKIFLNGNLCPMELFHDASGRDYYVDTFIKTIRFTGLKAGMNELIIEVPYGRKTNLENIFLLGDFGVEETGTEAYITDRPDHMTFGDITRQRMPFYGGNLIYSMEFSLGRDENVTVRVPHFSAPVLRVDIDGEKKGLIAFAPHELKNIYCSQGKHKLEICAYGNRFNTFGTLHNCNDEFKWYGPDSYRTVGSEWSESWQIRPFGILSRVEIVEQ